MANILKGALVADRIYEDLWKRSEILKGKGIEPCLCILRLGEETGDVSYERAVKKAACRAGVELVLKSMSRDCSQDELMTQIRQINEDDKIHGCLMFRPLPKQLDEDAACQALDPAKDLDGMGSASLARVFTGRGEGFCPCTAQAVMEMLRERAVDLRGKNVAVLGRSLVIGRPVAMLLMQENATVTICHSATKNMAEICRKSDIIVSAMGRGRSIGRDYLSPGQILIDVGVSPAPEGGICGDFDMEAAEELAEAVTPVPGGVGSVTAAVLLKHCVEAAERRSL